MAGLSYMQRRASGIYEFRRRLPQLLAGKPVPAHLRSYLAELVNAETGRFKRELTISLQTTEPKVAKQRDMREAVRVAEVFASAEKLFRGGSLPDGAHLPQLSPEEIEADIVADLLREDEREREMGDARRYEQTPEERAQWPDLEPAGFGTLGMAEGHWELLGENVQELLGDYKKALAMRRPDIVNAELRIYLKEKGVPIDPITPFYREAGLAVLKGHVKAYELIAKRHNGEDIPTPAPSPTKGPKLSEAFDVWKGERKTRGARRPSPKTVREGNRSFRLFVQWHGDLRLGDITREKARDFRDAIAKVPRDLNKEERKLTLRQLLQRSLAGRTPAHAGTVNKHVTLLGAMVSAMETEGKLDALPGFTNPFRKLALEIDEREEGRDKVFSQDDLTAIFGLPVFTDRARPVGGAGEAAYWLPLLAALSGARLGELAQLRLADIKEESWSGVWVMHISPAGDRTVKTVSSKRMVPLHPFLIKLGILRYRQSLLDAGAAPEASLWPDMQSADELNSSAAWSKWFNRTMREKAGITDTDLVFHSFRHTFKRLCRNAGIGEEAHDALTGHSGKGGEGRNYGKGFDTAALFEVIKRVVVPKAIAKVPAWGEAGEAPADTSAPEGPPSAPNAGRGSNTWTAGPVVGWRPDEGASFTASCSIAPRGSGSDKG